MRILSQLGLVVCLLFPPRGNAQTLRIAAASDLQLAMSDLAAQFEKQTGTKIAVSYGSSGNFRTQIQNGAPFDLFFSADTRYPQQLVSAGFADAQSLTVYARGVLVLWAPADSNVHLPGPGLAALQDVQVHKIAMANPEHAPYGQAAVAALQKAGIYEGLKSKLVFGENISQTAQFAQSGNAQVGIIALSLTFAESMKGGEKWEIPPDLYPPIEQAAVLINSSPNKPAARAFLEFVNGEAGQKTLLRFGFSSPARPQKP